MGPRWLVPWSDSCLFACSPFAISFSLLAHLLHHEYTMTVVNAFAREIRKLAEG